MAAACPGSGVLEIRACGKNCRLVRFLDSSANWFVGERPKHRDGLWRAEGHIPAGGMFPPPTAILNEPISRLGIETAERSLEFRLRYRPPEAQPIGSLPGPSSRRFGLARIVVIAAEMV